MNRWILSLLVAIPAALLAEVLHAPPVISFILASLGLIPLAGLIGSATEVLAERMGHSVGGLLNATFGNAAEIIIGITALAAGLRDVVLASLAGSIISNILLVLGSSMLLGGWRYRRQTFDRRVAGQYAIMLALVVIGLSIPALLSTVGESARPGAAVVRGSSLQHLSVGVAIVLLLCYIAYIASSIFGLRTISRAQSDANASPSNPPVPRESVVHTPEEVHAPAPVAQKGQKGLLALWTTTLWLPLVVLAAATAVTAVVSEILVVSIEPLTKEIGLNPLFVGLIILPIVGNAAEHFSAITSAARNPHGDLAGDYRRLLDPGCPLCRPAAGPDRTTGRHAAGSHLLALRDHPLRPRRRTLRTRLPRRRINLARRDAPLRLLHHPRPGRLRAYRINNLMSPQMYKTRRYEKRMHEIHFLIDHTVNVAQGFYAPVSSHNAHVHH